jgi:hypothetical protein
MIVLMTERQVHGFGEASPTALAKTESVAHVAAQRPRSRPAAAETSADEPSDCDPNYEGACLDPEASDYDCEGGSGNGPDYTGEVRVVGVDHFGLDADGDGIGCEAE